MPESINAANTSDDMTDTVDAYIGLDRQDYSVQKRPAERADDLFFKVRFGMWSELRTGSVLS
ncbi:hypothetical protein [Streptomyces sp. NPDC088766]|uniref:hypothetical protein n=1 Tax=Streptomyces sp. NPDC088766 TaxID=3365893 RepID=UPI00381DEDE8